MYKEWATKTSPCTATFQDRLCFRGLLPNYRALHRFQNYSTHHLIIFNVKRTSKPTEFSDLFLLMNGNELHAIVPVKYGFFLTARSFYIQ
jgi:hypothetical protein